jgi:beta-lactamase superfamily II metal-dependent hydrolase
MLEIEMLPAREGDCLWIRYGQPSAPKQILVDTGRSATYKKALHPRLLALPPSQQTFELFVITHVDRDHIEGALNLLEDEDLPITFKDIWFNGYDHLQSAKLETFGAVQGERLTAALLKHKAVWNKAWKSKAVAIGKGALPKKSLEGDITLTLLSPDRQKLVDLIPTWLQECKDAGLVPGAKARRAEVAGLEQFGGLDVEKLAASKFKAESKEPNGSSIAFLLEYDGKRLLLGADAHEDRLLSSLTMLAGTKKRVALDLFKVPHHGSDGNLSRELLAIMDCPRYLISTNGSYFKHPTPEAIARILKFGGKHKTIYFNYDTKFTSPWKSAAYQGKYGYTAVYPAKGAAGTLRISL